MTERAEHTAFTPGPWSHEEGKFGMENVFSGREGIIAQTYCLGVKGQLPGVANARLIAAAPDLLDALRNFTDGRDISYVAALEAARAAITKAIGGQS